MTDQCVASETAAERYRRASDALDRAHDELLKHYMLRITTLLAQGDIAGAEAIKMEIPTDSVCFVFALDAIRQAKRSEKKMAEAEAMAREIASELTDVIRMSRLGNRSRAVLPMPSGVAVELVEGDNYDAVLEVIQEILDCIDDDARWDCKISCLDGGAPGVVVFLMKPE